ncbi:hypothetical protein P154DRAFT_622179 [Amniculicola lignicola CBS 123094]|uniref:Uncharacterized protein n=1 Tax=Amniculicola lignicola CBS 123094 TaxID=1392246 RepID=A0A6A5WJE0_9PLEO|nr:hypothetical protein P154DRAFT_622179 [Amniculicola lignicola CBS 123094]
MPAGSALLHTSNRALGVTEIATTFEHERPDNNDRAHTMIPRLSDQEYGYDHFSGLPRELRNEIYHWLWKSTPGLKATMEDLQIDISYDGFPSSKAERQLLPSWLLTNKATLCEGIEQLRLKAEWSFGSTPVRLWPRSATAGGPFYLGPIQFFDGSRSVLSPIKARDVTLWLHATWQDGSRRPFSSDQAGIWIGGYGGIIDRLERVLEKTTGLKRLRIHVPFRDVRRGTYLYYDPEFDFDLSLLDQLCLDLDELEIVVSDHNNMGEWSPWLCQIIPEEVSRVGKLLVKGKMEQHFEEMEPSQSEWWPRYSRRSSIRAPPAPPHTQLLLRSTFKKALVGEEQIKEGVRM